MKKDTFAIVRFEEDSRMCHTLPSNVSAVKMWSSMTISSRKH